MAKKNPYIMTIGFKKDDPEHVSVAELLNGMGRGKAQYIVKAVLVYQNMQLQGETNSYGVSGINYRLLKEMVLQILDEREGGTHLPQQEKTEEKLSSEQDLLEGFDDDVLDGIMESLSMFQGL
jgi:hypothetical protein